MKKPDKRLAIAGAAALVLLAAVAIGIFVGKGVPKDDGILKIGFCADGLVIERWLRDQERFKTLAEEAGAQVTVYNANENNARQNEQIRRLIEERVDVIVIVAYDKDGIAEAVQEAAEEGIKIIAYDRLFYDAPIDAYISFNNRKVGRVMGESLLEAVPQGGYIVINGSPEDNNSSLFREGYMGLLDAAAARGDISILADVWAVDWREEHAYKAVADALEQGLAIDAVLAANDRLAEAAIRALAEKGMAGEAFVAGHDADIAACQRIVEGTQYMTVYKPIDDLAERAVALCLSLARGEAPVADETIHNGYGQVPYIKLDVVAVTAENMEETVVADGFHTWEAIYRVQ